MLQKLLDAALDAALEEVEMQNIIFYYVKHHNK